MNRRSNMRVESSGGDLELLSATDIASSPSHGETSPLDVTYADPTGPSSWDHVAPVYDRTVAYFGPLGRAIVDAVAPNTGERVLDVGAGRGASLVPAAERVGAAGRVVGIDASPAMVDLTTADLRAGSIDNADMLVGDAQRLAFPERRFDVVICSQCLGIVADPAAAIREFRRVLRPHGRVAIGRDSSNDGRWSWLTELRRQFAPDLPVPTGTTWNPHELIQAAGFVDIRTEAASFELVFPDADSWWRWMWTTGTGRHLVDSLGNPDQRRRFHDLATDHLNTLRPTGGHPMRRTAERLVASAP